MNPLTLAQRIDDLDTADAIWSALRNGLAPLGVDHVIYNTVDRDFGAQHLLTTLPELYRDMDPGRDPFLHWCCESYEATFTGIAFLHDHLYLPEAAQAFIRHAGTMGFHAGLAIPVRLTGSDRFGGFNLGTGLDREAFLARIAPRADDLRLLCLLVHRKLEETLALPATPTAEEPADVRTLFVAPEDAAGQLADLTPREREVLYLVARGLSRKECARLCRISVHTVSDYTKSAYRKLGLRNRAEAANLLARHGWTPG